MLYHKNRTFNNSVFITLRYRLHSLLQCRALFKTSRKLRRSNPCKKWREESINSFHVIQICFSLRKTR